MDTARFEDYRKRFEDRGADPEQVVRLFVEGLLEIERDRELAEQFLCVVIASNQLSADPRAPSGFRLSRADQTLARIGKNPNIARSLAGGTPAASYADADLTRFALDKAYSARTQGVGYPADGKAKFFVACGGADSPRPITLARNNAGRWKVIEWSSLTVGVKPAASVAGDF
jgi:hypothetical protein